MTHSNNSEAQVGGQSADSVLLSIVLRRTMSKVSQGFTFRTCRPTVIPYKAPDRLPLSALVHTHKGHRSLARDFYLGIAEREREREREREVKIKIFRTRTHTYTHARASNERLKCREFSLIRTTQTVV